MQDRYQRACQKFRRQQPPAWKRADQERAHSPGFPVIDHRERRLHTVEKLYHRDQSGRDVDLVKHVGLIWWNDRDAEDLPKTGGKNEKPDQRAHQRRDEALALMDKAQRFTPDDAGHADKILRRREAVPFRGFADRCHPAGSGSS